MMNDKMYEDMLKFKEAKKLVSVYSDTYDTERFSVGYIMAMDDSHIIIKHISPQGLYDGYILKRTEDIYQINYSGKYEAKILNLYNTQTMKHTDTNFSDENLVIALLKLANQDNLIVSLELHSSGIYDNQGIVLEANAENVLMEKITDFAESDGYVSFDIGCITKIACDCDNEQALKKLLNNSGHK